MVSIAEILSWHQKQNGSFKNYDLDLSFQITNPRSIEIAQEDHITFLTKKYSDFSNLLEKTKSKVIVLPKSLDVTNIPIKNKVLIFHDRPKDFIIAFCKYFLNEIEIKHQIHPTTIIEEGAKIGVNNHIGANVFISKESEIGDNCQIGANTVLKNCIIQDNVIIGSNSTIGETGFGYVKSDDRIDLFPHFGQVVIENNVHIGNNTCIDRGSLSDTIIKAGVKIDNLVHIAHNVIIGKNTLVIANSMIAGSVEIGENCWIAPSCNLMNGIKIGNNATIGLGSVVTKDIPKNQVYLGNPAIPIDDFRLLQKAKKEVLKSSKKEKE